MINIVLLGLLVTGAVAWICMQLKNWKQRVIFLLMLIVGIPLAAVYGFRWGWNNREEELVKAQGKCRQQMVINGIEVKLIGFTEEDLMQGCMTFHKNSEGAVLDSNNQQLDITRFYNGDLGTDYFYRPSFGVDDILEVRIGKKKYRLSNFVLTAAANYNMGGAIVSGCRIDSADINGKRVPFSQNMIIHKTDDY